MSQIILFTLQSGETAPFSLDGGSQFLIQGTGKNPGDCFTIAVEGTLNATITIPCLVIGDPGQGMIQPMLIPIGMGERYQITALSDLDVSIWEV